ncbi:hypothetical protein PSX43_23395, partial [Shigella flexneri]|nr:hypothetical protein [Shigella flexneri]
WRRWRIPARYRTDQKRHQQYIIICTVGVAFGLFGTVLVYANAASVMPQAEMAALGYTSTVPNRPKATPTVHHYLYC